ncbi:hypothetical protein [Tenacibaculum retecalamus]|uniref:hypothetical protein n=1 Tax=Tenacibaculum retecalamus TaxID=3018315 RepID=UPI0023D91FC8|nr:hypothetical protein [Tenacibaculum retecalamus]WBX70397.1 hypothetical protein PG912_08915 [Tenacibaculum retecalamus]
MSKKIFDEYLDNYDDVLNDSIYSKEDKVEFIENTLIENIDFTIDESLNFDKELLRFYSVIKRWKLFWKTNDNSDIELEGIFNILPVKEVLIGDVDFHPEKFPVMKNFTLLDFFYNEAAVGFYLDKPENGLYYFEFDANPQKLNLDFKGYLEMLKYTKGAAYWQKSIIELLTDRKTSPTIEKLNKLFPEVTVKGFYELYDSLKINKNIT